MAFAGIEPERLRLEWVSASEGPKFAQVMNEFAATIRELGPSPLHPPGRTPAPEPPSPDASENTAEGAAP